MEKIKEKALEEVRKWKMAVSKKISLLSLSEELKYFRGNKKRKSAA